MNRLLMISNSIGMYMFSTEFNTMLASRPYTELFPCNIRTESLIIDNIQAVILENFWVGIKNRKQLIFFNSDLQKSTDLAADSNGICDIKVN